MTDYNLWKIPDKRWVSDLGTYNQITTDPDKLTYLQARKAWEHWQQCGTSNLVQVRELLSDNKPGEVVGYNLWRVDYKRWTDSQSLVYTADEKPLPLTYEHAVREQKLFGSSFTVMEIGSDWSPKPLKMPRGEDKQDILQKVDLPAEKEVEPPTPPAVDFAVYNGTKQGPQPYLRYLSSQLPPKPEVDKYTGLPTKGK